MPSAPPDLLLPLADLALKSAVLFAAAALVSALLFRASAAARHLVWCVAIAGALLLPLLSGVLPAWRAAWLPQLPPPEMYVPVSYSASTSLPPVKNVAVPSQTIAVHVHPSLPLSSSVPPTAFSVVPLTRWLQPLWLAGIGLFLLPLLLGTGQMRRLSRRCTPLVNADWSASLAEASGTLQLRRRVDLRLGPAVNAPLTWGTWRPVILLPAVATHWPAARRRVVLLHELAHIQRWDWLTQTLAYAACALYWFNPLAWLAARQMRLERERACDDLVLRHGSRPSDYADELLQLATRLGSRGLINWAAVPMARRSTLEGRLLAILDPRRNRSALTRVVLLATLALAAAVIIPVAMLRADANQTPSANPPQPNPTAAPRVASPPFASLHGTIFSVPTDVPIKYSGSSLDQVIAQFSAAPTVLITPVPNVTIPFGRYTKFSVRDGFKFSDPNQAVVVDFKFGAQVDRSGDNLRYQIDSTHTHFPRATSISSGNTLPARQPDVNSTDDVSETEAHGILNRLGARSATLTGNVAWNQAFLCDLGPSGEDPNSDYHEFALLVFQPSAAAANLTTAANTGIHTPASGDEMAANLTRIAALPPVPAVSSSTSSIAPPPAPSTAALAASTSGGGPALRLIQVAPATLAEVIGPLPPADSDIAAALREALAARGLAFTPNAQLLYDGHTRQVVVSDNQQNVDRIVAILHDAEIKAFPDTVETRDYPMSQATLIRLTGNDGTSADITAQLRSFFVSAGVSFPEKNSRLAYDGNKIWVTNTPRNLDRLANLLQRYSEIKQIEVTAKFLEVQQGTLQLLGFHWNVSPGNATVPGNAAVHTLPVSRAQLGNSAYSPSGPVTLGGTFPSGSAGAQATAITQGTIDPVTGLLRPASQATVASSSNDTVDPLTGYTAPMIINALEQTQGANVIAAPRVTVLSGKEARIMITQNVAKPSGSHYDTDPIGITLSVLPSVNDDDSIDYSIKASLSDLVSQQATSGSVVQNTEVSELVTSGHANNGQTIVFALGEFVRPVGNRDSVPGGNATAVTPGTAHFVRYATIQFVLISPGGSPVPPAGSALPPGTVFQQPTGVQPTSQKRSSSAPAP